MIIQIFKVKTKFENFSTFFLFFNDETTEAIEEAERICKDSNRKRFSSSKELREAFGI